MRFVSALLIIVIFAGGYFMYTAHAVCKVPIAYRIGSIDEQFDITYDEVRAAVTDAESLWEDATGRNLFTFDEGAKLSINFVFDERQQYTSAEQTLREELDDKRDLSKGVREQYDALVTEYDELLIRYEDQKETYEQKLDEYNAEVAKWNDEGGAPEEVYDTLTDRQNELKEEQRSLNRISFNLNTLADEINDISKEGNTIVTTYNSIVERYNNDFSEEHEFIQGDFRGDQINIYQYIDGEELRLVLAHELGHALSLGHVEDEKAIMHFFMGAQDIDDGLMNDDLMEFDQICGDRDLTFWPVI